ncbi:MAG: alpha-L-fucosidase [Anaerolineae bacterium]|nr:alpha-L-fucosidase [Anaerolineae bacterium]
MIQKYEPIWRSLRMHQTPQWFRDAKFGIYTHWGIYSVPAAGPNVSWYPHNMYREGTPQYDYHVRNFGHPSKFGYKDFIPMFTADKFDPDQWAELFKKAGARFAGPVAEHHDGFPMWDTAYGDWNAAKMGPRRDVVGELERAIRAQDMKFMVAMHHAENWWFYPHWIKEFDTADSRYAGLYGELHNLDLSVNAGGTSHEDEWAAQDKPSKAFLDRWRSRLVEVVDKYTPDYIWFDFGLKFIQEQYKQDFLAYYYNKEQAWGREVVVSYKWDNLPPGTAVVDIELGKMADQTYYEWITDTTVDDGSAWGYMKGTPYKSVTELVQYLVDNVSKNGYMLLNVGPKPNGELPEEAVAILEGIGAWLNVNGEAIYDTVPWHQYGEGPTQMKAEGAFSDTQEKIKYTGEDFRFTVKDAVLYAISLGWPAKHFTIKSLKDVYPGQIQSVRIVGSEQELAWQLTDEGLAIERPDDRPCEHAFAFKITQNTGL